MVSKKQINLLRGWPNPSLLPTPAIARAAQTALSDPSIAIPGLSYGPDPGYQPLREEIAAWMQRFYGTESTDADAKSSGADRICITGGASQNLACVLQVYTDPVRTRVWMVAPCYFLACGIFKDAGLGMSAVPEGEEGVDLEMLEEMLRGAEKDEGMKEAVKTPSPWGKFYKNIIYCVPTFSNPSGKTMTLSNRQKLVQIARKYDALIITDDVYDCLQFPTSTKTSASSLGKAILPRLVDIDRTMEPRPQADSFGNAMSNGSFSKIAGPGVRTGWGEGTPKFTYGLSQCGSSRSGGAPSQMTATIMSELLRSGDLEHHIESVLKPAYKRRYETMIDAINSSLVLQGVKVGEVSYGEKAVFGGYFIWLELPEGVTADEVTERSNQQENLIVAPGRLFEVLADPSVKFNKSIRLCFAWEEEVDMREGVARLGKVIKDVKEGVSWKPKVAERDVATKKDLGDFK